jgi:sugar phosphate isomerase/epimerase
MDRRAFLGTMTAASLLGSRLSWAAAEHRIEKVGLQLYTVRTEMPKDFEGTIAKVAEIGYKEVEFAGYFNHSPQDVRAILDRHGLTAPSVHIGYNSLGDKLPEAIEAAKIIGHEYIVNPAIEDSMRKSTDGWKRAAETFNRAGETTKKAGIQFAYHNHWWEFQPIDGKLPYDIVLENADPNLVKMEMDLGWISVGGQDPLKYFALYPGRFPLVHVKDWTKIPPIPAPGSSFNMDQSPEMTDVGSGSVNWKRIFAQSDKAGIKHYFVERDMAPKPFENIRISYTYLAQLRF